MGDGRMGGSVGDDQITHTTNDHSAACMLSHDSEHRFAVSVGLRVASPHTKLGCFIGVPGKAPAIDFPSLVLPTCQDSVMLHRPSSYN